MTSVRWAYGVTTCAARRDTLLPRTLVSLCEAGFDRPRLFADGVRSAEAGGWEDRFGLEVTARFPALRTHGNWVLALYELYVRNPEANLYAVFQDDLVACRGLRDYLSRTLGPRAAVGVQEYWNLYEFPSNHKVCPRDPVTNGLRVGWYESNQYGRGAVGLAFSQLGVQRLLSSDHLVQRPVDAHRGWRVIDGGVVDSMRKAGWKEVVHNPSLVQHTGYPSSIGNGDQPRSPSFRGEEWDARSLLPTPVPPADAPTPP